MLIYEQNVNERFFQIFIINFKNGEKMKIIFKKMRFFVKLYKIFKIFKHTLLHKKYSKNVLTIEYFCAKIGIVKVFFTIFGNSFHNFHLNLTKLTEK